MRRRRPGRTEPSPSPPAPPPASPGDLGASSAGSGERSGAARASANAVNHPCRCIPELCHSWRGWDDPRDSVRALPLWYSLPPQRLAAIPGGIVAFGIRFAWSRALAPLSRTARVGRSGKSRGKERGIGIGARSATSRGWLLQTRHRADASLPPPHSPRLPGFVSDPTFLSSRGPGSKPGQVRSASCGVYIGGIGSYDLGSLPPDPSGTRAPCWTPTLPIPPRVGRVPCVAGARCGARQRRAAERTTEHQSDASGWIGSGDA